MVQWKTIKVTVKYSSVIRNGLRNPNKVSIETHKVVINTKEVIKNRSDVVFQLSRAISERISAFENRTKSNCVAECTFKFRTLDALPGAAPVLLLFRSGIWIKKLISTVWFLIYKFILKNALFFILLHRRKFLSVWG